MGFIKRLERQEKLAEDSGCKSHTGKDLASRLAPESCAVAREDEREVLTGDPTGTVLSCEINKIGVQMLLSETESNKERCDVWQVSYLPRAVGDPSHVETSFVRNLGDLTCTQAGQLPGSIHEGDTEDDYVRK